MPEVQPAIVLPQGRSAVFLVLGLESGPDHVAAVREICANADALERSVGARGADRLLSCAIAFGARVWDDLFPGGRPRELHAFESLEVGSRHAPATPGDILIHIRGDRPDLCFELGAQLMARLGPHTTPIDEVHGFRYFDDRDLIGFVDGTENPQGAERTEVVGVAADDDPPFAGGSYVMVQKYIHDLAAWRTVSVESQERIVGRTKLDDIELADDVRPTSAHNALTTLDEGGIERKILRHNMPFGSVSGERGTYFIGYAKSADILETMLRNMVVGRPPGNYDRLLDFTHAVTGGLFFAPSIEQLRGMDAPVDLPVAVGAAAPTDSGRAALAGTLNIGTLKDVPQYE